MCFAIQTDIFPNASNHVTKNSNTNLLQLKYLGLREYGNWMFLESLIHEQFTTICENLLVICFNTEQVSLKFSLATEE